MFNCAPESESVNWNELHKTKKMNEKKWPINGVSAKITKLINMDKDLITEYNNEKEIAKNRP